MKLRLLSLLPVLLLIPSAVRADLARCIDATCRITAEDGSRGTGCVFEISGGRVFVLTNAHVATSPAMRLEFWREGHVSQPLRGTTVLRSPEADTAVVVVAAEAFQGMLPAAIPLAPPTYRVQAGQTVASVGCAEGQWSTAWKGHVLGYDRAEGHDVAFDPPPANGRSGSAIFDADGQRIVALLHARREEDRSYGLAVNLEVIHRAIYGKAAGKASVLPSAGQPSAGEISRRPMVPVTLPGDTAVQCPGGICPAPQPGSTPWRLLPYRHDQDEIDRGQNQQIGGLYPTMPVQPAAPAAPAAPTTPATPPVDLTPIGEKLDRLGDGQDAIARLLAEMRAERQASAEPPAPLPNAPQEVEPAIDKAVEAAVVKATTETKAEAAAVKGEVEAAKQETSKLRSAVDALIGDRQTLQERFEARIEKVKQELGDNASRPEIAMAYAKDLVAEKLADGGGWTIGKLLAATLGVGGPLSLAVAAGAWLVGRKIGGGDPLLIQTVLTQVDAKLENTRLHGVIESLRERVDNRIESLRDRLHPQVASPPIPAPASSAAATAPAAAPPAA